MSKSFSEFWVKGEKKNQTLLFEKLESLKHKQKLESWQQSEFL